MTEFANNVAIIKAVVAKELLKKDFTGREGDKGEKGDKGDKGETGERGESIVGPQGPVGKAGRDGIDGIQGPAGKAGRDGVDGKDGRDGKDGQSIEGPEGPVGKAGQDGQDGRDGRGIKSIKVNSDNMLVVTYDDGDMTIAGKVSVTNKTEVIQNGAGLPLGHFAIYSAEMDDEGQLVIRCNNNKTFVIPTLTAKDIGGFADYNDTSTLSSPVTLVDDTWTDIPNNGLGAFSNIKLPTGVTRLLDPNTGAILLDELPIGSSVIIRMDYTVTPTTNNAALDFRYTLGGGAQAYVLETTVNRLDEGSGRQYRQALVTHYIYVGDDNTKNNPVQPQVKLSGGGTLVNAGMVIEVRKSSSDY
ncbi:MAG: collagen-like protein [Epibacterium sp.]|nr:collagen-like protein [Epibacterium sp.]NQX74530.1 collagen-like protein [Epibacterium sp.]